MPWFAAHLTWACAPVKLPSSLLPTLIGSTDQLRSDITSPTVKIFCRCQQPQAKRSWITCVLNAHRLQMPRSLFALSPRMILPSVPMLCVRLLAMPIIASASHTLEHMHCAIPWHVVCWSMVDRSRKSVSYTHLRAHETDSYLVC